MIERLFDLAAIRQNAEEVSKLVSSLRAELSNLYIKIEIQSPPDITNQIKQLNESYSKLATAITQVNKAELEQEKLATQRAKTELERERINTERIRQYRARSRENRSSISSTRQAIVTEEQLNAVLGVQARTMAEAAEQNRILRAAAKQLDLTQAENVEKLKTYNAQINENTNLIRANSDAATQQKMNIGNYNSVWKGMNTSVQQLVRELPAAKYGVDIFFLAISNNIPMLMDSINAIKSYNKSMIEMGRANETVSTFKMLTKSLLSWQTLIMVGVTLLVQYGGEIVNSVSALFKKKEAIDANIVAHKMLGEAMTKGLSSAMDELVKLQLLTKALNDSTLAEEERAEALELLRGITRDYLDDEAAEQLTQLEEESELYKKLQEEIKKTAHARAIEAMLVKSGEDFYTYTMSRERLRGLEYDEQEIIDRKKALEAEIAKDYNDNTFSSVSKYGAYVVPGTFLTSSLASTYAKNYAKHGDDPIAALIFPEQSGRRRRISEEIEFLDLTLKKMKAEEKLLEQLESKFIIDMYGENDRGGGYNSPTTEKTYEYGTIGWWEQVISELQELAKNTKSDKDYKKIMDRISEAEEIIAALKGEQNIYEQFLSETIDTYSIKSIEEERAEEIAAIEDWYNENIKLLQERGGEYAEDEAKALEVLQGYRTKKIAEINDKYNEKIAREAKAGAKKIIDYLKFNLEIQGDEFDASIYGDETELIKGQTELLKLYNSRVISEREYQDRLLKLQQEYELKKLQSQAEYLKSEYDLVKGEKKALQDELVNMENQLLGETDALKRRHLEEQVEIIKTALSSDIFTDENINAMNAELERTLALIDKFKEGITDSDSRKSKDLFIEVMDIAQDVSDQLFDSMSAYHEARLQMIEEETEAFERSSEKQLESLERLYEQGAISQAEYEARKRLAERNSARQREALEKKRREEEIRQAKWDKANAMAQAIISTAVAIAQNLATWWMIPIIAALGAAQIATIAATPIPKYAKGTDSHKGGLAIVGDGGRQEVILTNGGAYITPDTPTVVDLPRGAKVLPDINQLSHKNFSLSGADFLVYNEKGEPIIINDYARLEREQKLTRKQLEKQGKFFNSVEKRRRIAEYKSRFV